MRVIRTFLLLTMPLLAASCTYMKMNPPPDADKASLAGNNSCYLATASNMLAGAGYGDGATVQARSADIYAEMIANFGIANGGWTDTALTWWLSSANNTWPANPYDVVTVYGNKFPIPWANANGAQFIANELRTCHFVGLSISWPVAGPGGGSGGHAITGWGDRSGNNASVATNPGVVRVTDSDRETGGDVQQYTYDTYTNPNPGGANEGNGWYFDFDANHPFLKHIITLAPAAASATSTGPVQLVTGSYKITQTSPVAATDLHYHVSTDVDILSYQTRVDWDSPPPPTITEDSPRRGLQVDWNFSSQPVPQGTEVTITTEFVLPFWNSIQYDDVHFTYPDGTSVVATAPDVKWTVSTPEIPNAERIRNVTGGYVVGAFDIVETATSRRVGEYRLVHQYSFNQSPERHTLRLAGREGFAVTNVRIGHSYGVPAGRELWQFNTWMTERGNERFPLSATPVDLTIDWTGRLPYPQGEDITGRRPEKDRPEYDPNRKP